MSGFTAGKTTTGILCPILLLQFKTDDDKLEENQRRAVRMVRGLEAMPEDNVRLQELNLFSLQREHQETVSTDSVRSWEKNVVENISSQ